MFSKKSRDKIRFNTREIDIAPISFFFDVFPPENFHIPIVPVPMRMDKIAKGEATLIILPDFKEITSEAKKMGLDFDYIGFINNGLKNLVSYSIYSFHKITLGELPIGNIKKWFDKTTSIRANIPEFINLFTFINLEFIRAFFKILSNGNHREILLDYYKKMEYVINKKFLNNTFNIIVDGTEKNLPFYYTKHNKHYPKILDIDILDTKIGKTVSKKFIPYLMLDDLYECIVINKERLEQLDEYTMNVDLYNNINKGSKIGIFKEVDNELIFSSIILDELIG